MSKIACTSCLIEFLNKFEDDHEDLEQEEFREAVTAAMIAYFSQVEDEPLFQMSDSDGTLMLVCAHHFWPQR